MTEQQNFREKLWSGIFLYIRTKLRRSRSTRVIRTIEIENWIPKLNFSRAKRLLKFGEQESFCDELCNLAFSLLYTTPLDLPQNSFISRLSVVSSHTFLLLHTNNAQLPLNTILNKFALNFEDGFKSIENLFKKHNAVIIDPWLWCVVSIENWLDLKSQIEQYSVLDFYENKKYELVYSVPCKKTRQKISIFSPLQKDFINCHKEFIEDKNNKDSYKVPLNEAQNKAKDLMTHYADANFTPFFTNENFQQAPILLRTLIDKLISASNSVFNGCSLNIFSCFKTENIKERAFNTLKDYLNKIFPKNNYVRIFSNSDYVELKKIFFCCVALSLVSTDNTQFNPNSHIAKVLISELNNKKMRALKYFLEIQKIKTKTTDDLRKNYYQHDFLGYLFFDPTRLYATIKKFENLTLWNHKH